MGRVWSCWAGLGASVLSFIPSIPHSADIQRRGWRDSKHPKQPFQHIRHLSDLAMISYCRLQWFQSPFRVWYSLYHHSENFFSFLWSRGGVGAPVFGILTSSHSVVWALRAFSCGDARYANIFLFMFGRQRPVYECDPRLPLSGASGFL